MAFRAWLGVATVQPGAWLALGQGCPRPVGAAGKSEEGTGEKDVTSLQRGPMAPGLPVLMNLREKTRFSLC